MKANTIRIIALLLTVAVFLGVASCSNKKSSEEEETTTIASKTVLNTDKDAVIGYFNALMSSVKNGKAALKYSTNYEPKNFSLEDGALASLLTMVAGKMDFNSEENPLSGEIKYGDSLSTIIPIRDSAETLQLTADDILEIAVNPDEFSKKAEEESKHAENKDYTMEVVNTDPDVRKITITLKDETDPAAGTSLFGRIFDLPDRELIAKEFAKASDYIEYDGTYSAKYTGCTIYMEIDRVTDNVVKIEFNRNIEVTATVTGVKTLESIGTQEMTFTVNGRDSYEFDWTDPATTTTKAE